MCVLFSHANSAHNAHTFLGKQIWIIPLILTCPQSPQCPKCPLILGEKIMDTPFYFDMSTLPTMPTPSKEDKKNLGGVFYFDDNQHCPLRHQYMVTHINHYDMNKYVCIIFTCPHCPQCPQCPHLLWKIIWIVPFILTCPHCPQCPHLLRRVVFFRGGCFILMITNIAD